MVLDSTSKKMKKNKKIKRRWICKICIYQKTSFYDPKTGILLSYKKKAIHNLNFNN